MMMTNSKRIGNTFERRVCRLISLAVSRNYRDDLFWRTPSSGAIGWRSKKYDGDIMLVDESGVWKFNWIVECKTTRKGSIVPLRSSVKEYLRQCEARYADKKWLLILQIRGNDDLYVILKEKIEECNYVARVKNGNNEYYVYEFYEFKFDKLTK